ELDGHPTDNLTAFLLPAGGDDNPARLAENEGKAFVGSYVLGMGFTFDDSDKSGVANPIALMHELTQKNPRNAERIFPYIGGEEVNDSPTHSPHRFVINFEQMSEHDCRKNWPDLLAIVETKVRPVRLTQGSIVNPERWWLFARPASDLTRTAQE